MKRNAFTRSGRRPRQTKAKKKRPHTSYTPSRRTPRNSSSLTGVSSVQELTRRQHQFASMHKKRVRQHTTCFLPKSFVDTKRLPPGLGMSNQSSSNQTGSSTRHGRVVDAFIKVHEKMIDPELHDNIKAKYHEDLFQIAVHFCRREQQVYRQLLQLRDRYEGLEKEIVDLRDGYKSDYDLVLSHPSKSDLIKLQTSVDHLKTEISNYKKEHMKGMEESTFKKSSIISSTSNKLRIQTKNIRKKKSKKKKDRRSKKPTHKTDDPEEEDLQKAEEKESDVYTGLIKQKFFLLEDYVVFLKKKISVLEQSDNDLKTLVGRFGSIRDLLKDNEKLRTKEKLNEWIKKRFDTDVLLNSKRIFPLNRENKKPKDLIRQSDDEDDEYSQSDDSTSEFDEDEDLDSEEEEEWERKGGHRDRMRMDENEESEISSISSATLLNRKVRRKNLHYMDVKYLKAVIFALQNELFFYKDLSERLVPFNRENQVTIVQKYPMEFDSSFPRKSPSQFTALSQLLEDPGLDLLDDHVYGENDDELQEEIKLMEKRHQSQLKEEEHLSKDYYEEQDLSTPCREEESSPPFRSQKRSGTLSDHSSSIIRTMRQKNLALTKVLEQRNLELVEMRRSLKHLNSQLEKKPGKFQLKELETSIRRQLMEISRLNSLLEEKEKYYIFQSRYVKQLQIQRSDRSIRMMEMMKQVVKLRQTIRFLNKERTGRVNGCRTLHQLLLSLIHLFFESKKDFGEVFGSYFMSPEKKNETAEQKFDQLLKKEGENAEKADKESKKKKLPDNIFQKKKKKKKKASRDTLDEESLKHERKTIEKRNEQFLNFTYTNAMTHYTKVLNSVLIIQRWWRGVSTRRKLLKEGYYLIKKKSSSGPGDHRVVKFVDEKNKLKFSLDKNNSRRGLSSSSGNYSSESTDALKKMELLSVVNTIDDVEEEREFKKSLEEKKKADSALEETFRVLPMAHKCHLSTIGWDEKNSQLFFDQKSNDIRMYVKGVLKKEMLDSIKNDVKVQLKKEWMWVEKSIKQLEKKIRKKESIILKDRKVQTKKGKKMSWGTQAGVTQIQNVNII